MSERSSSAGVVIRFVVVAAVLGLGFGGGVLSGWATRKRTLDPVQAGAPSIPEAEVKTELAACKRELKALKKARAKPPDTMVPGDVDDAGLEKAAKVAALHKDVHECRVRETLQNAYVCGTIGDHETMYYVLVQGNSCADPPGIGEYLLSSVHKCAEFAELDDDYPAHLDEDDLTLQEKHRILLSKWRRKVTKDQMVWSLQWSRRECRRMWALPDE